MPEVAFTAYARAEDERRALAEGFQLHVAKPIEPAAFASTVARLSRGAALTSTPQLVNDCPAPRNRFLAEEGVLHEFQARPFCNISYPRGRSSFHSRKR